MATQTQEKVGGVLFAISTDIRYSKRLQWALTWEGTTRKIKLDMTGRAMGESTKTTFA